MDIETIHNRLRAGNYLIKSHAVQHALKEGFEVCEYADPVYLEIVTAYIPNEAKWEWPPFRRRRR